MDSLAQLIREYEVANERQKELHALYLEARDQGPNNTKPAIIRLLALREDWRAAEERANAARIRMLDARAAIGLVG